MSTPFELAEGWCLWPWVQVRGAGFPARLVEEIEAPELGEHPDEQQWREAQLALSARLRKLTERPLLREAITWQNLDAVKFGIDKLGPAGATSSRTRKRERMVASYLQRYSTKNDTIGFHGPIGWGKLADSGENISVQAGHELTATREVYFEPWAFEELAFALARDPQAWDRLCPRLDPNLWLEDHQLWGTKSRSIRGNRDLSREAFQVLSCCTGEQQVNEIVAQLRAQMCAETVDQVLLDAQAKGWVSLQPVVPAVSAPEHWFSNWAQRLPSELASRAHEALERLESCRQQISEAAGQPTELAAHLEELQRTFQELTGQAATRNAGRTYAGRTLVHQDCRRAVDVQIPLSVIQKWSDGLIPVLRAARWFCWRISQLYLTELTPVLAQLSGSFSDQIPLPLLWKRVVASLASATPNSVARATEELQQRFWEQLNDSSDCFQAPHPGWPQARHHSLDLMLAHTDNSWTPVLGELHPGLNLFSTLSATRTHPAPSELSTLYASDIRGPEIAPIPYNDFARCSMDGWLAPRGYHLSTRLQTVSWRPPDQVITLSDLLVDRNGRVSHRFDTSLSWHILELLERPLKMRAATNFDLFKLERKQRRRKLGPLVVCRDAWLFESTELGFVQAKTPHQRYLGCRSWALENELPPHLFLRASGETKPVFISLKSPLLVELLCHLVRKNETVKFEEVLPSLDETWLLDGQNKGYVSELRFIGVDPLGWKSPTL